MFLNFPNEIRKKRWYVSDQHSACHSVGLSRLESRGGEDGRAGNGVLKNTSLLIGNSGFPSAAFLAMLFPDACF